MNNRWKGKLGKREKKGGKEKEREGGSANLSYEGEKKVRGIIIYLVEKIISKFCKSSIIVVLFKNYYKVRP